MTNTTRRTALMGALAVPVAASAAALPAMANEPDPIFELIETYQRLEDEWVSREQELERMKARTPRVPTTPQREVDVTVDRGEDEIIIRHRTGGPNGKFHYATSAEEIETEAKSIPEEHRDHWIADRRVALAREKIKARRENTASGYADARRRCDEAYQAQEAAGFAMAQTTPTTAAGFAALLDEVLRYEIGDGWPAIALETVRDGLDEMGAEV